MVKKLMAAVLILTCAFLVTGCWDQIDLNDMLIVAGLGLDVDESGENYKATIELVNIKADGEKNIEAEIVEGVGKDVHSAMQNAMAMTAGKMYGNHCKVAVIGDSLARRGMDEVIDYVLRSANLRKTLDLMVARESTAESIIKGQTVKSDIVSYELSKLLRSNTKTLGNTRGIGVYQLHEALISPNSAAVVPTVAVRDNNGDPVIEIEGVAVLNGSRLLGYLDGRQSFFYNIAAHSVSDGYLTVREGEQLSLPISARVIKSGARYEPELRGEDMLMRVKLRVETSLDSAPLPDADLSDARVLAEIEQELASQLETDVKDLIEAVKRDYEADIFDFSGDFEDSYRHEWGVLESDWPAHFRDMEVEVEARVTVTGSGQIENYAPRGSNANALP